MMSWTKFNRISNAVAEAIRYPFSASNGESGNMLLMAVMGLGAIGAGTATLSTMADKEIQTVDRLLKQQSSEAILEDIEGTGQSVFAVRKSAELNTLANLKGCVNSGGGSDCKNLKEEFNLFNAFGERIGGTSHDPQYYSRYGARCSSLTDCNAAFAVVTEVETFCKSGTQCDSASDVRVHFQVNVRDEADKSQITFKPMTGSRGQGYVAVAVISCRSDEILSGVDNAGGAVCLPKPAAAVRGPQGASGKAIPGPQGKKGPKGPPGQDGVFYAARCGGVCGCFAPGVKILLADGSEVAVENLRLGMKIWNPDSPEGLPVANLTRGPEKEPMYKMVTKAGDLIMTRWHPVPTVRGMITAQELVRGDEVQHHQFGWLKIENIQRFDPSENLQVYNFTVGSGVTPRSHLVVADRHIVGDLWLQKDLGRKWLAIEKTRGLSAYLRLDQELRPSWLR